MTTRCRVPSSNVHPSFASFRLSSLVFIFPRLPRIAILGTQQLLHVEVKDALLQLVEQRGIARQRVTGLFLYCSQDAALRRRQAPAVAATAIGGDQQPPRAQIQAD